MDPVHLIEMNQGMMVSGIILALSFIGIFTETVHGFSRVKVAMLGGTGDAGCWAILWFLQS